MKNFESEVKKIYEEIVVDLKIEVFVENLVENLFFKNIVDKIIDVIILFFNGVFSMIGSLNVVESLCNLGEVYIKENYVYLVIEIRVIFDKNRDYIYNKIVLIGKYLGGEFRVFFVYLSWVYKVYLNFRDIVNKVYLEIFGENIKIFVVYVGLECGCFVDKI